MEYSCSAEQTEGRVVLTVVGDVDMAARGAFQGDVERWIKSVDIMLDCSGVTFMDSMGVRALVHLRQLAGDSGHEFVLAAPSPPVLRVLEVAGVSALFGVAAPEPDAGPESLV